MVQLWPVALLFACGALISIQATINVALGKSLNVWFFAFIFTIVQLVATFLGYVAFGRAGRWSALLTTPGWQYIGGVIGLFTLVGMAFSLGRTGTVAGFISIVVGQLIAGIVIDHYGLFNAAQTSITITRVAGVALVVAGLFLARA